jgi:hypothetical protein
MSVLEFQKHRKEQYDCVVNQIIPEINNGKYYLSPVCSGVNPPAGLPSEISS